MLPVSPQNGQLIQRAPLNTSREPRCWPDRWRDATRAEGNGPVLGEVRNKVAARSGRNPKGRAPVRLGSIDCGGARGGLTFIAKLNMHLRKISSTLKINPQRSPCNNEASEADWAVLHTLAVSRYCLRVSALPVVQQPYGAATTGN